MNITIHSGTHKIGGCVTEYEYGGWHLFVDYGEELPGGPKTGDLKVEGLTHGDLSKSALLITHYHGDHIGCITKLPKDLPIYMGKVGRDIQIELSDHLKLVDGVHQEMFDRLQTVKTFEPGRPFKWEVFNIMPVTVDHSAFDAYAFKIEADNVRAFHTGDFRTHGFRSSKLPDVINKFVGEVDYVVCEATNIARPNAASKPEHDLQMEYQDLFTNNKGNVVYVSSTNIDRLFGLYHAAYNTNRVFIIDEYQKSIMDIVTQKDSLWGKSKLYKFKENYPPFVLSIVNGEFWMNDKFQKLLQDKGYVLIARSNPRFDKLIANIPGGKQTYLSMWDGYVDKSKAAYNEKLAKSLGVGFMYKHTSGHCDMNSLREVIRLLHPKAIIPIHTDSPEDFAQLFSDEWPIVVLNDGDSISPISSRIE
jgi:ribonuclease J